MFCESQTGVNCNLKFWQDRQTETFIHPVIEKYKDVWLSVAKDPADKYIVFLYSEASYGSQEGLFCGGEFLNPSERNSTQIHTPLEFFTF